MKNGVPWDVAWSLEDHELLAYTVIFGQYEGNEFDWNECRWLNKTG